MKKEIDKSKPSVECSSCYTFSNIITDQDSNETICINCGCIMNCKPQDEKIQYNFPNKENTDFKIMEDRAPGVLSRHDMGLSTVIGKTKRCIRTSD